MALNLNGKINVSGFFRKVKYSKQFRFYLIAVVMLTGLVFSVIYLLTFIIKNLNIGLSQNVPSAPAETFAIERFEKLGIIKK